MSEMLLTAYDGAILGPIAKLLGWVMNGVYYLMDQIGIGNVGLSIIIFTIIIYLLLFPLTYKQQKFSKLSQKMQPELNAINKKYQGKSLSKAMEQRLFDRDFIPENSVYYPVTEEDTHTEQILVPVTRDGDPIGAVCFLGMRRTDPIGDPEKKVAEMVARYLTLTMDN